MLEVIHSKSKTSKRGILKKRKNQSKREQSNSNKNSNLKNKRSRSTSKKRLKKFRKSKLKSNSKSRINSFQYFSKENKSQNKLINSPQNKKMKTILQGHSLKILKKKLLKKSSVRIIRKNKKNWPLNRSNRRDRETDQFSGQKIQDLAKNKKTIAPQTKKENKSHTKSYQSLNRQKEVMNPQNPQNNTSQKEILLYKHLKRTCLNKKFKKISEKSMALKKLSHSKLRGTPKERVKSQQTINPYVLHSNSKTQGRNETSILNKAKMSIRFPFSNQVILPKIQGNKISRLNERQARGSSSTRSQRRFQSLENNVHVTKRPRNIIKLKKIISINSKGLRKNSSMFVLVNITIKVYIGVIFI